MTAFPTLDSAHDALRQVVAGVPDGAWSAATPCAQWNATQVLQHAAGDQQAYTMFITGTDGPDYDPFAPSGTIDADPNAFVAAALDKSAQAFGDLDPANEAVPTPLPQGAMAADQAAGAAALDAAIHAWDLAMGTGQPSPLTPELARELLPVARALVEPLRAYGAYAAAIEADTTADDVVLLNYLGRRADWRAA
jgi:uncharacterized protein (TIGR03086 family)